MKMMIPFIRFLCLIIAFFVPISNSFASQVVLVTGASRGIGFSIADLLVREGYIVYAGVRDLSSFKQDAYSHLSDSDCLHIIPLDVTDQSSIDRAVEIIAKKEGRIDVLVNNAGIMVYGSVENVTIEEAQRVFDVNFFGVMRVTQAVLPLMREQKQGKIIQISSRSGFRPLPSLSVYAASKFALEGLSETMAATLKPWNIAVSLIEPGPVNTDLDFLSPYGSRLTRQHDPYYSIFEEAGLLDPISPVVQQPLEIAQLVKEIIETSHPLLRYQTTEAIKKQAAKRLFDITGLSSIEEWHQLLFQKDIP